VVMKIVGILVAFLGFVISLASVALGSNGARLGVIVLGIVVSLFGILGILNAAHLKYAIWKTGAGTE
jgi:hypothetical protein